MLHLISQSSLVRFKQRKVRGDTNDVNKLLVLSGATHSVSIYIHAVIMIISVMVPVCEHLVCALLLFRRHHIIFNDAVSQEELYYPPHPKKTN